MKKEEFIELQNECHNEWRRIGDEGDVVKSSKMIDKFQYGCPACSIALATQGLFKINGDHTSISYPDTFEINCQLCPILKWRRIAIKKGLTGFPACCVDGELYGKWESIDMIEANNSKEKIKKIADSIIKLKWIFLKIYEQVPMELIIKKVQ